VVVSVVTVARAVRAMTPKQPAARSKNHG